MSWLAHFLGLTNGSGVPYLFWSGVGSDIGEVAIIGGVATMIRHHQCHARWCWRIKRHPVAGTPYVVCRRHATGVPNHPPTVTEIHAAARKAN